LKKVIRKVMAIGYLPVLLVRQNFHLLRTSRRTMRLCKRFPELTDFLDYFQRNYLNANGSFPPRMWNVFGRTMDNRTNNNVESKYELKVPFCNQLNKTSAWISFFFFFIIWTLCSSKISLKLSVDLISSVKKHWRVFFFDLR
jgi:hypothetical protein